MIFLEMG